MAKETDRLNHKACDGLALPSFLSERQQYEMQGPDDDWSGTTDPAKRRKLQNRVHQRAWSKDTQTYTNLLSLGHDH